MRLNTYSLKRRLSSKVLREITTTGAQSQPKLGLGVRVKGLLKPLVFANEVRERYCANVYPHTFLNH